ILRADRRNRDQRRGVATGLRCRAVGRPDHVLQMVAELTPDRPRDALVPDDDPPPRPPAKLRRIGGGGKLAPVGEHERMPAGTGYPKRLPGPGRHPAQPCPLVPVIPGETPVLGSRSTSRPVPVMRPAPVL